MAQFPLTVAAIRLGGISLYTLRQWCEKAHIDLEQQRSLADPRAKWLSEEQLQQLAGAHGRVLDQPPIDPELIPPAAYKLMMEQVAQALQQYEHITGNQAAITSGLADLGMQQEAITRQLTVLEEADREQAEQQKHDFTALSDQWKTTGAALEVIEQARQAEKQAVLNRFVEVVNAAKLQDTRIEEIATASHQQAEQQATFTTQLTSLVRTQQEMQERVQQTEQRLQAQLQSALTLLRQETQAELEQRTQNMEATHARELATLAERVQLAEGGIENYQRRLLHMEQLQQGQEQLIKERDTTLSTLEKRVEQLSQMKQPSPTRKKPDKSSK